MMSSNNLSTERPRTLRRISLFPNLNPHHAQSLVYMLGTATCRNIKERVRAQLCVRSRAMPCRQRVRHCADNFRVCVQPDLVFSPNRDGVRRPNEATTGRNALLLRLGLPEDVCQDALNPGERPRLRLRARCGAFACCALVLSNSSAYINHPQ